MILVNADIPALLRREALEALDAKLDFPRNRWQLGELVARAPLRPNAAGRCECRPLWDGRRLGDDG